MARRRRTALTRRIANPGISFDSNIWSSFRMTSRSSDSTNVQRFSERAPTLPVTTCFFHHVVELVIPGYDLDRQVGNEALHAAIVVDQAHLVSSDECHIRTVGVAIEIELLFGD